SYFVLLTRALAGLDVVVAAHERRRPVGHDVLRARQVVRPRVADDGARRLPYDLELTVLLDLADEDGFRDVVIRHHRRDAAGEIRHGHADDRLLHRGGIRRPGLLDGFDPHVESDVVRLHRIVRHALAIADERVPLLDELVVLFR